MYINLYRLNLIRYTKRFSVNIGRAHLCAALGELSSEHAVFNIQFSYIWHYIIFLLFYLTKKNYLYTMYMTPYKKFYYYIIRCLNHFFFSQEKETLHQRKSACSLRSPIGSKGRSPPLISPWSMASWWKKPCNFPLTLCATVKIDISSSYLFHLIKTVVLANIGRAHLCASLGAQSRIC